MDGPTLDVRHHLPTALAVATALAIAVFDHATGLGRSILPLYVLIPVIGAAGPADPRRPLWAGGLTLLIGEVFGHANWSIRPFSMGAMIAGVVAMSVITSLAVRLLARQRGRLRDLDETSQTVRGIVQPPVPPTVGSLRTEVRYLTPPSDRHIGGDVCSVSDTPFGVRLLLGDVAGRGVSTLHSAAELSYTFRDLAWTEEHLSLVAAHLHSTVLRRGGKEEFATALLAQARGPAVELLACGHPPPLLLNGSGVSECVPAGPRPPLGVLHLGESPNGLDTVRLDPGDRLLFYTNGVTGALNERGEPYPLAERAARLETEDPAGFLDALQADLLAHVAGGLGDDAVLLLVQPAIAAAPTQAAEPDGGGAAVPPEPLGSGTRHRRPGLGVTVRLRRQRGSRIAGKA
ncbi:PP2C family protein-serine/threonine phosphatase [Actinomadura sp. 9N407]|uniref:PP2C family protein-serine/threonine phosphatase n=1 Tax=Actinomadura sp. 9N407 TaxID=3375154 RepID=UPI003789E3FA